MSGVEITRRDLSASQLRLAAAKTVKSKPARRILAIAMALEGHDRALAARAGGMDRQTLRDWVHRYNAEGLAGLADRPRPGRKPRLTEAQQRQLAQWVQEGPDLARDGVVRWRCADLAKRIKAEFDVDLQERAVGKILKKLNYSSISGRPLHPLSDLEAQETFKKSSPTWPRPPSPKISAGAPSRSGSRMRLASASRAR
jgi:transposase